MLVALINIVLGLIILLKNKSKNKASLYFSLMCFSAGLWTISLSLMLLDVSKSLYIFFVKGNYLFSTGIFVSFLFFCIEFSYKVKKILLAKYLTILLIIFTLYIFLTNSLFQNIYYNDGKWSYDSNIFIHLTYGIIFAIMLIYSYYLLFCKYKNSQGVNRNSLLFVIIGTFISFLAGIYFDWIVLYVNQYYLFWLGPIFSLFMTFSIAYLLFKKN